MGEALTPAAVPTRKARFLFWTIRVVVACAELWIAYAWFSELASLTALVSMHLASVAAFFGAVWLTNQTVTGNLLIDGAMLFLTGPLAAVGILLHRQERPVALSIARRPMAPVSPAASLYSDIMAGRRPRRDPSNQLSILDRLSSCDLATQQFAVAAISRAYCPEMHPALMAALQSQTPAVRVQAAAVFAKLREQYALEAKRLLEALDPSIADAETFARRSQTVAACREIARSPFLDDAVTQALMNRACHLEAELAPTVSALEPDSVTAEPVMEDKPGSEITKILEAHAGIVEAQSVASSRIVRLSKSSSSGMERVA
jgi:hypothetical protein